MSDAPSISRSGDRAGISRGVGNPIASVGRRRDSLISWTIMSKRSISTKDLKRINKAYVREVVRGYSRAYNALKNGATTREVAMGITGAGSDFFRHGDFNTNRREYVNEGNRWIRANNANGGKKLPLLQ